MVFCLTVLRQTWAAQAGLKLFWDYRCEPPCLAGVFSSASWDGFVLGVQSGCHAFPLTSEHGGTVLSQLLMTSTLEMGAWTGKMAQWDKALATRPDNLSSWWKERQLVHVVLCPTHMCAMACFLHTLQNKCLKNIFIKKNWSTSHPGGDFFFFYVISG